MYGKGQSADDWVDADGIRFDANACILALQQHLIKTLILIREEYMREIASHYAQSQASKEASQMLSEGDIITLAGYIAAEIVGDAYAAMAEWGRGSKMDPSNPALDSYRSSDMWNPARKDLAIRTRPDTPGQKNIFGEPVIGHGTGGVFLENKDEKYIPWEPTHGMVKTAARWLSETRLNKIWKQAIDDFPWGNFIVTTSD